MSKRVIQWSNHANRANGIGKVTDENGEYVKSVKGYVSQAFDIATDNAKDHYSVADIRKAASILRTAGIPRLAADCDAYLAELESKQ